MVGIDLDHASKHLDLSTLDTVDSPLIERESAEQHSSGTPYTIAPRAAALEVENTTIIPQP